MQNRLPLPPPKIKVLLAAALLVMMLAAVPAMSATLGATYSESITFRNSATFTNHPDVAVLNTNGLSIFGTSTANFKLLSFIHTDAAGKLSGLAAMEVDNAIPPVYNYFVWVTNSEGKTKTNGPLQLLLSDTNSLGTNKQLIPGMSYTSYATGYEHFLVDITGAFGNSGTNTTLTLAIKGNGYMVGSTNPDGTILPSDISNAFPATISLKFSGKSPLTTNVVTTNITDVSTNYVTNTVPNPFIFGKLSGTISSKLKIVNAGKPIPASLTNAVFPVTLLTLNDLGLSTVVQFGDQIAASGALDFVDGTGTPFSVQCTGNNGRQRGPIIDLSFATVAHDGGSTFTVIGDKGPLTVGSDTVPSALTTNITLSGKVFGQTIKSRGGFGTAQTSD